MVNAILARKLRKIYPEGVEALRGIDLEIPKGSITTILGRNGAGKTTFIKIATTQMKPTSGIIEVMGIDVVRYSSKVKELIALTPQGGGVPGYVTPYEFIYLYLAMRGKSFSEARARAREILELFGLSGISNRKCVELSLGTQQRVLAAAAIASDADIVFLDEPTSGIDAIARKVFWSYLKSMKRFGRTFIVTTHIPEEAEYISDYIAIFDRGKVISFGTPRSLINDLEFTYAIEVSGYRSSKHLDSDLAIDIGDLTILYYRNGRDVESAITEISKVYSDFRVRPINIMDVLIVKTGGEIELD